MSVEPGGVELLSKVFYPLIAKTADSNFLQTAGFVASLSRTAEVNSRGVERLAGRLTHVQPEVRRQFAELAVEVARRASAAETEAAAATASPVRLSLTARPSRRVSGALTTGGQPSLLPLGEGQGGEGVGQTRKRGRTSLAPKPSSSSR